MANIGTTTAFYKVEASLSKANTEVSKSMERLATGRQNANAGDRSSYVAMADTFRLDYVGTKAGIKGASVVKGYLETAMATLDAASSLLSRLQELAILGANDTNTTADSDAIDFEAEKIADELHRLLSNAKYKGKDLFVAASGSELVAIGGRGAEMTFGVQKIITDTAFTNLYDTSATTFAASAATVTSIVAGRTYFIDDKTASTADFGGFAANASGVTDDTTTFIATASGSITANVVHEAGQHLVVAPSAGKADTDTLTAKIEAVQAVVNTARVQAGSQYAAIESAMNYTTDLTAQYELGFNTVNDVNFSMETAHLAKNQILQQAATAMLAQANMGQQSLLQLIQG
jgi:flagellin